MNAKRSKRSVHRVPVVGNCPTEGSPYCTRRSSDVRDHPGQAERNSRSFDRVDVREEFPLRNFVSCATCGRPLTASWSRGRSARYSCISPIHETHSLPVRNEDCTSQLTE